MNTISSVALPGEPPEFQRFLSGSRPLDLSGIDWDAIPSHSLSDDVLRVLTYMQDVESHTVVFPRTVVSRRAADDPIVGPFLICWLYEEGMHGRALAKFLNCANRSVVSHLGGRTTFMDHVDRGMTTLIAAAWKHFLALHMAWGAAHECTTIHAYQRLMARNDHPVLNDLLARIVRDEARHFAFYRWQSELRLSQPGVQHKVRCIMERFYTPVGAKHQPDELAHWVSGFLFDGTDGRAAAQRVDRTIARLPGLSGTRLLGKWLDRHVYH